MTTDELFVVRTNHDNHYDTAEKEIIAFGEWIKNSGYIVVNNVWLGYGLHFTTKELYAEFKKRIKN